MSDPPQGLLERGHDDTVLRAAQVSRFAVPSPSAPVGVAAAIVLGLVATLVLAFGPARVDLGKAATVALAGLLVPALLSAAAAFNFYSQLGGTITARRSVTLAVTDLTVVVAYTLVGGFIPSAHGDAWVWAILIGTAHAASVNMIVLAGTADPNPARALAPALTLPVGCNAVLLALGLVTPLQFYLGLLFVLVFAAMAVLWIRTVIAPFERNFKENGLELLHAVLDAWAGWSATGRQGAVSTGTRKMEAFFARHGEPREVRFDAMLFGQEGGRRLLWFLPELHPGPYADLGGSDLPAKAAAAFTFLSKDVAVFHGASTHDENPTGRGELSKLFDQVQPALVGASQEAKGTKAVRRASAHFTVTAQRIGKALVVASTRAPRSSDDLDLALGREIRDAVAKAGFPDMMLLDGHNCVEADLGRVHAGGPEARELTALCVEAAKEVAALPEEPLRVGWVPLSLSQVDRFEYAVGSQGILTAVTEVALQKTAWVLIDGNNLKAGLRTEMLEAVKDKVQFAEVFTTDNHAVNSTMGADNEIGSRRDNVRLVGLIGESVEKAAADVRPAHATFASGAAPDLQVFGPGLTERISATINAAVSVMLLSYFATIAAALMACVTMAVVLS
jgi:putative membrane protein